MFKQNVEKLHKVLHNVAELQEVHHKRIKEEGITLIALIITIIILVILAAVSINAAYNSGIINYAVNGTQNYVEGAKREEEYVQNANNLMQSVMNRVDGLPVTAYTQPYFPSEDFKRVTGTYLANGLVIEDTTTENQFVWIQVPNDGSGPDYSAVPAADDANYYTKIAEALQSYAITYRQEEKYQDVWYDGCGLAETGENSYENVYHRMLASVYTHGGFWIGKYETGIAYDDENGFRSAKSDTTPQNAVIKKDAYPYNFVTCSQAQALASSINSGTCTSSLMFGIQWDLVIKYLETKVYWDTSGGYTAVDYLKKGSWTDSNHGPGSTSFGNYRDASFTITSENAKRSNDNGGTSWLGNGDQDYSNTKSANSEDSKVLLTTGANEERNSKMNICDLAGNVREWTLEARGSISGATLIPDSSKRCAARGGTWSERGWSNAACQYGRS